MSLETQSFEFGEFLLDAREKVLLWQGKPLPVTPKVFQMLLALVERHGRIVEKDKLMEIVWADSFVEESNLTFTIRQLRKILGDDKHHPRFIETVARRGYRFIAEVRENPESALLNEGQSLAFQQTSSLTVWRSHPALLILSVIVTSLLLLAAGFFIWRVNSLTAGKTAAAHSNSSLRFETLTSSGRPISSAISPDGKYIAYTNMANGQESLWLRQLSSGINTQIVPPESGVRFSGLEFSGKGEYIYFIRRFKNEPTRLDRVSILGGAVKTEILTGVDGAFSISPDDRRISFRQYDPRKRSLLIAGIDGSNPRPLFETTKTFTDNVFSPDGKRVAFASGQSDTGGQDFGVYLIDAEGGEIKPATDFKWHHVRGLLWLPDQSGLLVTARLKNEEPQQLWKISLPAGEVEKITDTQNSFDSISATSDLSQILLTQISLSSNLYLASPHSLNNVQPIAQATEGVVWTPEGNLVYSSAANGNNDIWLLSADKTNQKQLTTETSTDFNPKISPDGRYIVFVSDRAGKNNLWRIDAVDGGNPVQLTRGEGEQNPVFTPDGADVVFNSMKDVSLWKVSVEGGEAVQISDQRAFNVSISPDGTKFAHFTKKEGKLKVFVKSFPKTEVLQEFAIPEGFFAGRDIIWKKDGSALIYATEDSNSVGNLWQQSLTGGEPQKLTNYTSDEIFYFDFAPDNSQLAIIRGSWNYGVILVKGFK